jgi:4-hydroxy-3-methylbut-2-enyl diphosphate reductase IspH
VAPQEASLRLDRIEEEIGAQAESVERISALRYNWGTGNKQTTLVAAAASADALVWQMTASVMMPGFTINRIVTLTALLVQQYHVAAGTALESVCTCHF